MYVTIWIPSLVLSSVLSNADDPDLSGNEMLSIEEDSDLSLSCDSRANPPVTMVWHRNGQLLDLSDGRFTATNNGVTAHLSATNVKRHLHEGNYTCVAKSTGERQLSKNFEVTVTGWYPHYLKS